MGEGCFSIETAKTSERPTLIGMLEDMGAGGCSETKGIKSSENIGESFE